MMIKSKSKADTLARIIKNVERSMELNKENTARFNRSREFVLKDTLTAKNKESLSALDKPIISFNISEAFLNRLRGEFVSNEPSCSCSIAEGTKVDRNLEMVREICEGHLRYILAEARRNGVFEEVFSEMVSGGFSASKVSACYENGKTFKQKIVWEKVWDPTLCGFDVLSRDPSRKDSSYAFELHPYTKEAFEEMYEVEVKDIDFNKSSDGFNWYYKINDEEIIVVAEYYEKKKKKIKIVELSTGEVIEKEQYETLIEELSLYSLEAPPVITQERMMDVDTVFRYQLTGDTILEKEEVKSMDSLGLVMFSGNPVVISTGKGKSAIMQKPFLYNCEGAQKLYNNLGVSLADECQKLTQHKIIIAEESISPNYEDHITQPQKYDTLVYRAFYNNDANKPNPPPIQMARNAFPPEMMALWQSLPNLFQNILGSYDAEQGMQGGATSGVAIIQGAIHSSATAKPYITNFMLCLNQVANVILHMIPKIYVGEFTLPIINQQGDEQHIPVNGQDQPSLKFDPNNLRIVVEAGVGSSAAKSLAIQQIIQLTQASPIFSQFINTKMLPQLIGNLELRDQDLMVLKAEEFMQELEQEKKAAQQAQGQQIDPMQLKQQEIQMRMQKDQMEIQAKMQKVQMEGQLSAEELEIKKQELALKEKTLEGKLITEEKYQEIEAERLEIARAQLVIDMSNRNRDMSHRHHVERTKLHHSEVDLHHKHRMSRTPHFSGE